MHSVHSEDTCMKVSYTTEGSATYCILSVIPTTVSLFLLYNWFYITYCVSTNIKQEYMSMVLINEQSANGANPCQLNGDNELNETTKQVYWSNGDCDILARIVWGSGWLLLVNETIAYFEMKNVNFNTNFTVADGMEQFAWKVISGSVKYNQHCISWSVVIVLVQKHNRRIHDIFVFI